MTFDEETAESSFVIERNEERQARADVYRLLGALLASPPNVELLNMLKNIEVSEVMDDDTLTSSWHALRLAAQQVQPGDLEDEYFNLFIGL
ncbi:hypothetical protein, partial [Kaarinaea lacus]